MRKTDLTATLTNEQELAANAGVKGMVSIGRPFLDFVLSAIADAGFTRVCIVIGPEHDIIRDYYIGMGRPTRLEITFAIQEKPLGTANALLAAADFAGAEPFVVLNSDNYYPSDALSALRVATPPAIAGFSRKALIEGGNIAADRVTRFGALQCDENGFLTRILVGPAAERTSAGDALASMNCWLFDERIFDACRRVPVSARGEYELPQAVQLGIDNLGMRVQVVPIDAAVLDLSSRGDIALVAERLKGVAARP
jgi:glucose-1-phosphate thymidylyltransferase